MCIIVEKWGWEARGKDEKQNSIVRLHQELQDSLIGWAKSNKSQGDRNMKRLG